MVKPGIGGRLLVGLFGIFLIASATIAALAAITVLWPHGFLIGIWSSKQTEYHQLLQSPFLAGGGFAVLSVVLAFAAVGWFIRRRWAWILATVILGVNLVSDFIEMVLTRQWADATGVFIGALVLVWLISRPVRIRFVRKHRNKRTANSRHRQ